MDRDSHSHWRISGYYINCVRRGNAKYETNEQRNYTGHKIRELEVKIVFPSCHISILPRFTATAI